MDNLALVLLLGGGDLATGVALRLHRAGIRVVITELPHPLTVRRSVSFAEAIYEGVHRVEGITARRAEPEQILPVLESGDIPVIVDPNADILLSALNFLVAVDARLLKISPHPLPKDVPLHIGLGPGFHASVNCHAVVETRRSHTLGRLYWNGQTQPDSGKPEGDPRRVLRAPKTGILKGHKEIGQHCESGERIAEIDSENGHPNSEIVSPFKGVLRGLIHDGVHVTEGLKIGDVDPRDDPTACFLVSDKALAIGGAVLEAILTREGIRAKLWK